MITGNKFKKSSILLLVISLVVFLLGTIISYNLKRQNEPKRITERINREISTAETKVSFELKKISLQVDANNLLSRGQVEKTYINNFAKEGTIFLAYQGDTLRIWTDMAFQAPRILTTEILSQSFILGGNGYYLSKVLQKNGWTLIGLQLVKFQYKLQNDYLPEGFYPKFSVPSSAGISLKPGIYNVISHEEKFLFSLIYENDVKPGTIMMFLVFILYISSFLCLVAALLKLSLSFIRIFRKRWILLLVFVIDVIILRSVQFHFQFPGFLYDSDLFSPVYFASSEILPSLGDLLINTLLAFQLSYFIYRNLSVNTLNSSRPAWLNILFIIILISSISGLFEVVTLVLRGLVLNSSIPLRFDHILSLNMFSLAGLVVIAATLFAFWLLFETAGLLALKLCRKRWYLLLIAGIVITGYECLHLINGTFDLFQAVMLCLLIFLLFIKEKQSNYKLLVSGRIFFFLLVLAFMATYVLNKSTLEREHEQRTILATHLSDSRDKLAEYYYKTTVAEITADPKIPEMLRKNENDSVAENEVVRYISRKYFLGFWAKYHVQLTLCHTGKKLKIKPDNFITECEVYFDKQIKQFLQPLSTPGLYFVNQSVDVTYYLGKIGFSPEKQGTNRPYTIYVEINSKNSTRGLGYPELLMDKSLPSSENLTGYSYAFYYQGELVRNVGKYFYDIENEHYVGVGPGFRFFNQNKYSHLIHGIDDKTTLLLSQEKPGAADIIAPFSFIFLFLILFLILIYSLAGKTYNFSFATITFRLRLQVFMTAVILGSSVIIGSITLLYLNQLNYSKNKDVISEKMNTVLVELENRFGNSDALLPSIKDELSDQLLNLSNTNFTDINIYGLDGILLSSSRSQIFDEGLISEQMNPEGMYNLVNERKSFFIHSESIGRYNFLSAYAPLRNYDNKLIGYLNLPYFARQEDLRQEVSRLLAAYANIYILMIAIAVFMALLLSRYITKPLQLIKDQLGNLKFGRANAKVEWHQRDEIGSLVAEYNRMIDELSISAEMLARSERESAWREMAKQVAHEIKNPLTPIKLSMQHLMKAWDDKAPDWDSRLKKFSQTLIMQIDTLSAIASEFSDFAQMPESNFKRINIESVIAYSVGLFKNQDNVRINFNPQPGTYYVNADENQMLRVFNNLVKNSIQAIPSDEPGRIDIELKNQDNQCLIRFTDNGSGIPTEQQTRIFSPNFTTKSTGMGLGLAMVKNIIDNSGGKIWFDSVQGSGTTFSILLPSDAS